jgi:hypothetical protein
MPVRKRDFKAEAVRREQEFKAKALHPLLRTTRHKMLWQTILGFNQKNLRGMTSGEMKDATRFHPQVLADLQAASLVKPHKKRGNHVYYVADPTGKGKPVQEVYVTVQLLETDKGEFVTKTHLHGRVSNPGEVRKLLAERRISFKVPAKDDPTIAPVFGQQNIDDNVIIDVDPDDVIDLTSWSEIEE